MKLKQKISKRVFKFVSLLISVSLLSAGCGGGNNQPKQVVLNVWNVFEDSQTFQPFLDAYRQKFSNVQIVYTKKNLDTYQEDLINALAAGTGPDIFAIHNTWLPKYVDKITEAPAQQWAFVDYKKDFVDAAVKDFTRDQKIYAVPLSVDSLALYYNKDILGSSGIAVPPRTWEELSVQTQKVKKQDRTGYFTTSGPAIGTNSNVNRAVDIAALFMLQLGAQSYSQDGTRATFADSVQKDGNYFVPGLQALRFYTSFANPESPNYSWNQSSHYSTDAFAEGRAAFLYGYSYVRQTILSKAPNLNFDVATVPQPDLKNPAINFANYWGLAVSKQSKNADYAWDFLETISSKENLDKYYAQNKVPSSRRDLVELQALDPEIGVFATANLTAKTFYKPDQERFDSIFGKMIDNVILKGFTAEDALRQAEEQADTLAQ